MASEESAVAEFTLADASLLKEVVQHFSHLSDILKITFQKEKIYMTANSRSSNISSVFIFLPENLLHYAFEGHGEALTCCLNSRTFSKQTKSLNKSQEVYLAVRDTEQSRHVEIASGVKGEDSKFMRVMNVFDAKVKFPTYRRSIMKDPSARTVVSEFARGCAAIFGVKDLSEDSALIQVYESGLVFSASDSKKSTHNVFSVGEVPAEEYSSEEKETIEDNELEMTDTDERLGCLGKMRIKKSDIKVLTGLSKLTGSRSVMLFCLERGKPIMFKVNLGDVGYGLIALKAGE